MEIPDYKMLADHASEDERIFANLCESLNKLSASCVRVEKIDPARAADLVLMAAVSTYLDLSPRSPADVGLLCRAIADEISSRATGRPDQVQ